jgi:hypothetical protein
MLVFGENIMSLEKPRPRPRRSGIESEEERAWVGFYKRVGRDPAIATEVMAQLESDPEMKRTHLALYLCCKESLRRHKARQARNKRIGQFVRGLGHAFSCGRCSGCVRGCAMAATSPWSASTPGRSLRFSRSADWVGTPSSQRRKLLRTARQFDGGRHDDGRRVSSPESVSRGGLRLLAEQRARGHVVRSSTGTTPPDDTGRLRGR